MKEAVALEKKEKIEIGIEKQEKKTLKLLGSQRHIPGLALWEYNNETGELKKAEFVKETITLRELSQKAIQTIRKKIVMKEGCYYFQALNRKNAIRKLTTHK